MVYSTFLSVLLLAEQFVLKLDLMATFSRSASELNSLGLWR